VFSFCQIAPEDLSSAGNQDKARELQVEDEIEEQEQDEKVQEQMQRNLEDESHEVCRITPFWIDIEAAQVLSYDQCVLLSLFTCKLYHLLSASTSK